MRTYVKICGLSEREHVLAAIEAGADAIGFVFVNSVRRVSIEKAINISQDIDSCQMHTLHQLRSQTFISELILFRLYDVQSS